MHVQSWKNGFFCAFSDNCFPGNHANLGNYNFHFVFLGIKGLLSESGRRRMREAQRRRELEEQRNKRIDLDNPKNPWGMLAQNWGRKESQEEDRIDYQALLRKHTKGGGGRPFFLGFYLLSF